MTTAQPSGPLAGIRVLDFTHMVAGPYMTLQMAYLGAEVIKVESRRRIDGWRVRNGNRDVEMSWPFADHNKGKRGITVNLKHPLAAELIARLASRCDVVTENFSTGVMERLGLDDAYFHAVNPRLIIVHLPAMGRSGPRSDWVAWGPNLLAYTGFTHRWNHPGAAVPVGTQTSYLDYVVGLHGAAAVAGALLWRRRTGKGTVLELAQAGTAASLLGPLVLSTLLNGIEPPVTGNHHPAQVPSGCYPCREPDAWCALTVADDRAWARLARIIGGEAEDEAFRHLPGRLRHRKRVDALVRAFTRTQNREDLLSQLVAAGIGAAPVATGEDLAKDGGLSDGGYVTPVDHPKLGRRRFPGPAMRFVKTPLTQSRRAPLLGEHTARVLREVLGAEADELREWMACGLLE